MSQVGRFMIVLKRRVDVELLMFLPCAEVDAGDGDGDGVPVG